MKHETILARSPTKGEKGPAKLPDKAKLQARVDQLFERREPYMRKWKQIRDHELPFIGDFDENEDKSKTHTSKICNGVAWDSSQVFAAGVMSGLTPPSRQWFKLAVGNRKLQTNTDIGKILDERQDILTSVLAKSNFYNAVFSVYTELPFGQGPMGIFQNAKTGVQFVPYTVGTYALDVGADGQVNAFCRKFYMTAEQMREQFGEDSLPRNIRESLRNNSKYRTKYKVVWLVEPNTDRIPNKAGRRNMPYSSVYWVDGSGAGEFLYVGGFEEWAIPTARYMVTGLEPYAKGAGWFALDDSKMLQALSKDYLTGVELGVKPPMQVPSDLAMEVNLFPGGVTVADGNEIVKPLFAVNMDLSHLDAKILRTEEKIKRTFFADLFLMLDSLGSNSMTAREVLERTQEKLQQLGPMVERLQYEFLNPIIERVYNILDRAGLFPPIPDEVMAMLADQDVKIEYISPLAQAQKMNGLTNIEQAVAFIGQMMQLYPEVRYKLQPFETVDRYFNDLGAPAVMLRSNDEAQKMLEQDQQAAAQQEQMKAELAAMQQAAPAAQAAKNLTDAANDGNPAIREWLGMGNLQ